MVVGIEQLTLSDLRPPGAHVTHPTNAQIDQGRLYGLEVLPPIRIRKIVDNHFEILSGTTTWMVAQRLRIDDVSAECLDLDDEAATQLVHDDYGQSSSIDPITKAERLHDEILEYGVTRRELGERYNLTRAEICHALRLLQLNPAVKEYIREGRLSGGKGRALVGLPWNDQVSIAERAVNEALSTRAVEQAVRDTRAGRSDSSSTDRAVLDDNQKDSNTRALEQSLSEHVGSPVTITSGGEPGCGELTIKYFSLDELQNAIDRLQGDYHESNHGS